MTYPATDLVKRQFRFAAANRGYVPVVSTLGHDRMTATELMLSLHPLPDRVDRPALRACIEACLDCAQGCTACADACLAEPEPAPLTRCIRLCLDCADVCEATARVLSRQTQRDAFTLRTLVLACAAVTAAAALECLGHAPELEHCRLCTELCRRAERACLDLAQEQFE